jgi:hypothetical protein
MGAGAALAPAITCEILEPCGLAEDIVIGAALVTAGALLTHESYVHQREQRQIRAAAKIAGITYEKFSEYLHQYKGGDGGRGPGDNYTLAELVVIAHEAAQYYASHN